MISNTLDLTTDFNANNGIKVDFSGWESAVFHIINPSGTINITGTNDGNAQTGVTDGNAQSAINFTALQATNVGTGVIATTAAATGLYRLSLQGIPIPCKYVQLSGTGITVGKIIAFVSKPY